MSVVADRILSRLDEVGLTASRASEEAGLSKTAVRDIVTGKSKSPTIGTLTALCGPLECDVSYLTGEAAERVLIPLMRDRFWMVLGIGQGVPRYQHTTKESAQSEAKRLAGCYPEIMFVVLEVVDGYRSEKPTVNQFRIVDPDPSQPDDDGIPF